VRLFVPLTGIGAPAASTRRLRTFLCLVALLSLAPPALGEIAFEEVTRRAGIEGAGETFGASWGDFNADGWPDLWVSNHTHRPNLYLNLRDGTFRDASAEVWSADPGADTHAAAWADFDNDGDQDLVELVGAVITEREICIGCGENHLFENEDGALHERAEALGVHRPVGLGRTPLWLDADRDGRLDLLVVNQRLTGKAASLLYRQTEAGFRDYGEEAGFIDLPYTRYDKGIELAQNLMALRFWRPDFRTQPSRAFAQLADLSGDESLDLILFSVPVRVYSVREQVFEEITIDLGFPQVGRLVSDASVEDFDGDGKMDMYVTRGPYTMPDVIQKSDTEVEAMLGWSRKGPAYSPAITFRSEGPVTFRILYPYWLNPSQILIGSGGRIATSRSITLSSDDPDLQAPLPDASLSPEGVSLGYDPSTGTWMLRNSTRMSMELAISSERPIEGLERVGFKGFREQGVDALLMQREEGFVSKGLSGDAGRPTACNSVAAGDFDNDMDVDLYLVCSGPIENLPNRLLVNDGKGNFALVRDAGGAAGSGLGRGDVAATADYDRDGFLDLFLTNGSDPGSPFVADGPHQLFRNQGNDNHWVEIDLVGVSSNRPGIGASLTLEAGGIVQRRGQGGGMHVYAQNHPRIHFGLGPHETVDRITIRWPSGRVQQLEGLSADRILEIEECSRARSDGSCMP
jgi:hypothetical protein